ncbi:MAG: hypothetical protein ACRDJT_07825, partial [Actinomycetota bacterium]
RPRARAAARPSPDDAPVTIAVFPSRFRLIDFLSNDHFRSERGNCSEHRHADPLTGRIAC